MSEVAEASADLLSAGVLLRRAREASGLHVAALAVALKVPVRKLEALEDGRYDDVGDIVFVRALASSVCRSLKIDPQAVLERLPQSAAPRLVSDYGGLNTPYHAPTDGAPANWRSYLRQPVPLTVMALLLGAVVIAFWPARHVEDKATVQGQASAPTPAVALSAAPSPAPTPAASSAPAILPVVAAVAAPAASAAASAAIAAPIPAASAASPSASAPATGIVVIRTKGDSWVEVVDAKGVVAVRKVMNAGESAGASGALPLSVTIGRVDMTEVQVRGKKFDMRGVSKDNVARFDIK